MGSVDELSLEDIPRVAVVAVNEEVTPIVARALLERGCDVLCAHPVARTAAMVNELAYLAAQRGRVIGTDYTMALAPGALIARDAVRESGPLLRVGIEHPGRLLPMALHLALFFGGPVTSVYASRALPPLLRESARRSPGAFSPSLLLEHESGVVSSLLGVPHASVAAAFRCTLSGAAGRVDVDLPHGDVRRVRQTRGGECIEERIFAAAPAVAEPFGELMKAMFHAFLSSARSGAESSCPLSQEAHVRAVWNAIPVALRTGARALVELPS